MGFLSGVIGAVKNVVGSITGGDVLGLAGGLLGDKQQSEINSQNAELQRQFAQEGIRWKVADAKAAGIHPLYALGAQVASPTASYVSGGGAANALQAAGSNMSRAIMAKSTTGERLAERLLLSQIRGQEIDNDLKASQFATRFNSTQLPPGLPGSVVVPKEVYADTGSDREPGQSPMWSTIRYGDGTIQVPGRGWADANLDEGPANFWLQATRTLPQMIARDGASLRKFFRRKGYGRY